MRRKERIAQQVDPFTSRCVGWRAGHSSGRLVVVRAIVQPSDCKNKMKLAMSSGTDLLHSPGKSKKRDDLPMQSAGPADQAAHDQSTFHGV
jgi:hypothetical protein